MSSGRLFLDRVARQPCPPALHQPDHYRMLAKSEGVIYHRTATSVLTGCLTQRAHPNEDPDAQRAGLPASYREVSSRMQMKSGALSKHHRLDLLLSLVVGPIGHICVAGMGRGSGNYS